MTFNSYSLKGQAQAFKAYIVAPSEDEAVEAAQKELPYHVKDLISTTRELETSVGEYLFELMSGDEDSAAILSAYLEDSCNE